MCVGRADFCKACDSHNTLRTGFRGISYLIWQNYFFVVSCDRETDNVQEAECRHFTLLCGQNKIMSLQPKLQSQCIDYVSSPHFTTLSTISKDEPAPESNSHDSCRQDSTPRKLNPSNLVAVISTELRKIWTNNIIGHYGGPAFSRIVSSPSYWASSKLVIWSSCSLRSWRSQSMRWTVFTSAIL